MLSPLAQATERLVADCAQTAHTEGLAAVEVAEVSAMAVLGVIKVGLRADRAMLLRLKSQESFTGCETSGSLRCLERSRKERTRVRIPLPLSLIHI